MPLEPINRAGQALTWRDNIPVEFLYTAGLAGERFLREIKENARIMGTWCPTCEAVYVPARLFCPQCFAELSDWVDVGDEGVVESYTIVHLALDGSPLEEPEVLALIQLDGADTVLLHRLQDVEPEELRVGLRVKAAFKPASERAGSILDIEGFEPA